MKQAINTRTREEYDALMRYYKSQGIDYSEPEREGEKIWEIDKEQTCISVWIDGSLAHGSVAYYKSKHTPIIPYTEFAKANIMEELKLTKEEARDLLRGRYVVVRNEEEAEQIERFLIQEVGMIRNEWGRKGFFPSEIGFSMEGKFENVEIGKHHIWQTQKIEIDITKLLSIVIVPEIDFKALYLEGRKLLEEANKQLDLWSGHQKLEVMKEIKEFLTNHKDGE